MKRIVLSVIAAVLFAAAGTTTAFAGNWIQDVGRPANQNGVTNWRWNNGNGNYFSNGWAWIDGNGDGRAECYCFNADGYMYGNTTTPDQYYVDANGAWVKNGIVQQFPNIWVPGGTVYTADTVYELGDDIINPMDSGFTEETAMHSTMTDAEAYAKLMQIKARYPHGMYYDDNEVYLSGMRYGYGCAAFIFIVQDWLYGAPARPLTDYTFDMNELRVGDHIRVENNTHSVIVLSKGNGYITVAEGNYYKHISWGRVITEEELRRDFVYRETCY